MVKILLVENDPEIANIISAYLENESYSVEKCSSSKEAIPYIETEEYDLAILDVKLPEVDGFDLCKRIRKLHVYPIIMLTAEDSQVDMINGLMLGADDYVTKPFKPLELLARVKAQLRRYIKFSTLEDFADPQVVLTYRDLELNTSSHECHLKGEPVALTPTEFAILRLLLERRGHVVTIDEIFRSVWGEEYYNRSSSTITVHIRHIREKLNDTGEDPLYVKTVWGIGYKI